MKKPLWMILAVCGMVTVVVAALTLPDGTPSRGSRDADPSVPTAPATDDAGPLVIDEPAETPPGMAWIPGGEFTMGTSEPLTDENPLHLKQDEYPAHPVELDGFWMDQTPVTNRQFAEFVAMTGYVTFAETAPTRADFAEAGVDVS